MDKRLKSEGIPVFSAMRFSPKEMRRSQWPFFVLFCLIFLLFYVLNVLTPLWCDDLDYASEGHSLGAIFNREVNEYLYHSGRFVSHSTVQFFGGILGKGVFNVLNSLMTLVLIIITASFFGQNTNEKAFRWRRFFLLCLSLFLVWFVLPDQYITMFMIAGSSNYIWAAVLNLTFLYFFKKITEGYSLKGEWRISLLLALSFFAGTWMELFSIAILPAIVLFYLFKKNWKNKYAVWMIVLYGIGASIVTLAPGNFVRHGESVSGRPGFVTWFVNQLEIAIQTGLIWVWLTILLVLIFRCLRQGYSIRKFAQETFLFQVAIAISYAFVFVSGVTSARSEWGIVLFSFVILFVLLSDFSMPEVLYKVLSVILIIYVVAVFFSEVQVFWKKNCIVKDMVRELKTDSLEDNRVFLWPEVQETRKSIPAPTGANGNWPGEYVARYYEVPSFIIAPREAWLFCDGKRDADSLFCNGVPLVGSYALFSLGEKGDKQISVNYQYENRGYVFRSGVARLLKAFGWKTVFHRIYDNPCRLLGGRLLMERMEDKGEHICISDRADEFISFCFGGEWILAVPVNVLLPSYQVPGLICTVE